jgi:hypothetical protein
MSNPAGSMENPYIMDEAESGSCVTLRDLFAAFAIAGLLASEVSSEVTFATNADRAATAYGLAEAMLDRRKEDI